MVSWTRLAVSLFRGGWPTWAVSTGPQRGSSGTCGHDRFPWMEGERSGSRSRSRTGYGSWTSAYVSRRSSCRRSWRLIGSGAYPQRPVQASQPHGRAMREGANRLWPSHIAGGREGGGGLRVSAVLFEPYHGVLGGMCHGCSKGAVVEAALHSDRTACGPAATQRGVNYALRTQDWTPTPTSRS